MSGEKGDLCHSPLVPIAAAALQWWAWFVCVCHLVHLDTVLHTIYGSDILFSIQ